MRRISTLRLSGEPTIALCAVIRKIRRLGIYPIVRFGSTAGIIGIQEFCSNNASYVLKADREGNKKRKSPNSKAEISLDVHYN